MLRNLWDNFKRSNIRIIGVLEEEEEQEIENIMENFPNLAKEIDIQEAQRVPRKLDPRKNTPRHIIIVRMGGDIRMAARARGEPPMVDCCFVQGDQSLAPT